MSTLDVSLACAPSDRTAAVLNGEIQPTGLDLQPVPLDPETATVRMLDAGDFDAAEVSMAAYLAAADADDPGVVAVPVFPSRGFVQSRLYADVEEPADLAGGCIGVEDYWATDAIWLRGVLAERHGLAPDDVHWHYRSEPAVEPTDVDVGHVEAPLADQLEAGKVEAVVAAEPPEGATRLFDDARSVERDYYRETGHFPTLTVVVVDAALYDRHPWVAQELYKALDAAKDECLAAIGDASTYRSALPWLPQAVEEARDLMGRDYWPYGVDGNAETVEALARHAHEQGLTDVALTVDDLFAPETFEAFKV